MANIITKYITKNPYYNDGKWISGSNFKGFFLHSVGCSQPNPLVFINNWDKASYTNAGINGFIGEDAIYITAPCLETKGKVKRMPHGGKAASNNYYIGFEMCEPSTIKYTGIGANFTIINKAEAQAFVKKTYENAVQLFATLCTFHGKNPLASGVILSHNEAGKQGIASGHVDPEHLWKGVGLSYTMDGFRNDVKTVMNGGSLTGSTATISSVDVNYQAEIIANGALNCRSEPISGAVLLTYPNGTIVTITKEQNGWGYTGTGWISLAYIKKISTPNSGTEDDDMDVKRFEELWLEMRKGLQDNDAGTYSAEARQWATSNGLIAGNGTTINGEPNCMWGDLLTREQFVTVLYRFAQMMGKV